MIICLVCSPLLIVLGLEDTKLYDRSVISKFYFREAFPFRYFSRHFKHLIRHFTHNITIELYKCRNFSTPILPYIGLVILNYHEQSSGK